jgi:hypothetical protein
MERTQTRDKPDGKEKDDAVSKDVASTKSKGKEVTGGKRSPLAKGGKESKKPGEDDEIQKLISAKSDELDRGGKNVRTSGTTNKPKLVMVEASMPSSDSE